MSEQPNEGVDQPQEPTKEAPSVDLSAVQEALMSELDKRFSGFQGLLDKRTAQFETQLAELKTADMSPEEREQFAASEAQKKVERLERENELLRQRKQYAEEVDLLEEFFKQGSLTDQLALLAKFRKAVAAEEPQGGDDAGQPTPVDMNNPKRRTDISIADASGKMDEQLADKLLGSASEKGFLSRLRRG